MFNNLYSMLRDFFTPTKPKVSKDNIEFGVAQVIDILPQNWFLVGSTSIVPDFEEDEGVARTSLKTQVARGNKVSKAHFQRAPIDLDEEMEDVEEVGGIITES
jgi:hypothetical protein